MYFILPGSGTLFGEGRGIALASPIHKSFNIRLNHSTIHGTPPAAPDPQNAIFVQKILATSPISLRSGAKTSLGNFPLSLILGLDTSPVHFLWLRECIKRARGLPGSAGPPVGVAGGEAEGVGVAVLERDRLAHVRTVNPALALRRYRVEPST